MTTEASAGREASLCLADSRCEPCRTGQGQLTLAEIESLLRELGGGWTVAEGDHLTKDYTSGDFASALGFTVHVGAIAEAEGHHPDLHLSWGKVKVEIWTHKVDGLTRSDFILAAKFDRAHAA
jgi:4a-hydroxytetrahydrobiopterin dehydratase